MEVVKAKAVSMRSAHAALLLTTALAWGVSAQAVGTLRGLGRNAEAGSTVSQRMPGADTHNTLRLTGDQPPRR